MQVPSVHEMETVIVTILSKKKLSNFKDCSIKWKLAYKQV